MTEVTAAVGLLATGDELIVGDIANSNGQYIASQLNQNNISPGFHLTVDDDEANLITGMKFLLSKHRALITIGGLGPTSDDLTRFALAKVVQQELVFDEGSWQAIVDRLHALNLMVPENNRQQCLFPKGAKIIPNSNGTAAACQLEYQGHDIFMLPGPPNECRPIFDSVVLPYLLKQTAYPHPTHRRSWLLLSVSEGDIADRLQAAVNNLDCHLAYRADYPYLEVKLSAPSAEALQQATSITEPLIQSQSVSNNRELASSQLITYIINQKIQLSIDDQATHGHLASTLLLPQSIPFIHFNSASTSPDNYRLIIKGLESYWQGETIDAQLAIHIEQNDQVQQTVKRSIRYRKQATLINAIEQTCWILLSTLKNNNKIKAGLNSL